MIYDTPADVADWMASFVPTSTRSVLEPSAGNGALLKALSGKLKAPTGRILAVDVDGVAASRCRDVVSTTGWVTEVLNCDYLSLEISEKFDCALMNPPFCSRRGMWVSTMFGGKQYTCGIEAAFVLKAIECLNDGGRMIGLLPACIVNGAAYQWLRRKLTTIGSIDVVHELPQKTFRSADVKAFIMVFDKRKSRRPVRLWNHALVNPEELIVPSSSSRLDYCYHDAKRQMRGLRRHPLIVWKELECLASILRGNVATPTTKAAIHTTNYSKGFWISSQLREAEASKRAARPNDILVRRVARNCASTFGVLHCRRRSDATDCVLIVRPLAGVGQAALLFALRVFYGWNWARVFVEMGTGASFISQRLLAGMAIPSNLHEVLRTEFQQYVRALRRKDFIEMTAIEATIRCKLLP
jgi:hypothetical protein